MNSIYGIYSLRGKKIDPEWLTVMSAKSQWWKPKEVDILRDNDFYSVFLGNRATSLTHFNSDLSIISDCRIDNLAYLQDNLGLSKNGSIDEIILALYQKHGAQFPSYLSGAFTGFILDKRNQRLTCFVDHMGIKNLYYYIDEDFLVFAVEKKTILCLPFVDKTPNWKFIVNHITTQFQRDGDSEYISIKRVPAASTLQYNIIDRKVSTSRYWNLDVTHQTFHKDDKGYEEEFVHHFENAVICRVNTDDKIIGSQLSGGLDSSGITGVASHYCQNNRKEFHALGYTVPDDRAQDFKYDNENNKFLDQVQFSNIDNAHRIEHLEDRTLADVLYMNANYIDGYPPLSNIDTEYEILQVAQNHQINVMLSGFGGDELVTSFIPLKYFDHLDQHKYIKYFKSKHWGKKDNKKLWSLLFYKAIKGLPITSLHSKLQRTYEGLETHNKNRDLFINSELFDSEFIKRTPGMHSIVGTDVEFFPIYGMPITMNEYQRTRVSRVYIPHRIEAERAAGRKFHIDYRYPMLDIRLLQYVMSLPPNQKIKDNIRADLYRRSLGKYMPDSVRLSEIKSGSIKPISTLVERNKIPSLIALYEELKNKGHLQFLNHEYIKSFLDKKTMHRSFHKVLFLGILEEQGKLEIDF